MATTTTKASKWPKQFPPLTDEQRRISDDFMKHWLEVLPGRYGMIERFNQGYSIDTAPPDFKTTLEIGAGLGVHLRHEKLTPEQRTNYYALEIRPHIAEALHRDFPEVQVLTADCQKTLPLPDGFFDRILAIHVLEHLPDLPATIREMHRLCAPERGRFSVVIPCEGSMAYGLARRVSAQRIFQKRYKQPYRWFISREHINRPNEILQELDPYFEVVGRQFFPFRMPWLFCNLVIGLTLKPRSRPPAGG